MSLVEVVVHDLFPLLGWSLVFDVVDVVPGLEVLEQSVVRNGKDCSRNLVGFAGLIEAAVDIGGCEDPTGELSAFDLDHGLQLFLSDGSVGRFGRHVDVLEDDLEGVGDDRLDVQWLRKVNELITKKNLWYRVFVMCGLQVQFPELVGVPFKALVKLMLSIGMLY